MPGSKKSVTKTQRKARKGSAKPAASRKTRSVTAKRAVKKRRKNSASTKTLKSARHHLVRVRDPKDKRRSLTVSVASDDADVRESDIQEAAFQVRVLHENRQLSRSPESLKPGETHAVETTSHGERQVVRKRFSAI